MGPYNSPRMPITYHAPTPVTDEQSDQLAETIENRRQQIDEVIQSVTGKHQSLGSFLHVLRDETLTNGVDQASHAARSLWMNACNGIRLVQPLDSVITARLPEETALSCGATVSLFNGRSGLLAYRHTIHRFHDSNGVPQTATHTSLSVTSHGKSNILHPRFLLSTNTWAGSRISLSKASGCLSAPLGRIQDREYHDLLYSLLSASDLFQYRQLLGSHGIVFSISGGIQNHLGRASLTIEKADASTHLKFRARNEQK